MSCLVESCFCLYVVVVVVVDNNKNGCNQLNDMKVELERRRNNKLAGCSVLNGKCSIATRWR